MMIFFFFNHHSSSCVCSYDLPRELAPFGWHCSSSTPIPQAWLYSSQLFSLLPQPGSLHPCPKLRFAAHWRGGQLDWEQLLPLLPPSFPVCVNCLDLCPCIPLDVYLHLVLCEFCLGLRSCLLAHWALLLSLFAPTTDVTGSNDTTDTQGGSLLIPSPQLNAVVFHCTIFFFPLKTLGQLPCTSFSAKLAFRPFSDVSIVRRE